MPCWGLTGRPAHVDERSGRRSGCDSDTFLQQSLDAARENAFSRMLVGIHFRRACVVGLKQGRDVARSVLDRAPFLRDAQVE